MATANYVARRFGIQSAMSAAEALRRCPEAVFVRPRHCALPAVLGCRLDGGRRGRAARRANRAGRGLPRPRHRRAGLRGRARRRRGGANAVRAATSLSCSLGVSTSKVVCKVASDRRKPGGITVVPPGREPRFLAPLPVRRLPGVGPRAEERLAAAGVVDGRRSCVARRRRVARRAARRGRRAAARPGARRRPARPRAGGRADLDLDGGDLRARRHRPRRPPRRAAPHGRRRSPRTCAASGCPRGR